MHEHGFNRRHRKTAFRVPGIPYITPERIQYGVSGSLSGQQPDIPGRWLAALAPRTPHVFVGRHVLTRYYYITDIDVHYSIPFVRFVQFVANEMRITPSGNCGQTGGHVTLMSWMHWSGGAMHLRHSDSLFPPSISPCCLRTGTARIILVQFIRNPHVPERIPLRTFRDLSHLCMARRLAFRINRSCGSNYHVRRLGAVGSNDDRWAALRGRVCDSDADGQ